MKYIGLLFLVVLCSCTKAPYAVKYSATGTSGTLYVSYIDENGLTQNYTGTSPWNYSMSVKSGASLKVSAHCDALSSSTVDIKINNVDKASDTETGTNATVTANAN